MPIQPGQLICNGKYRIFRELGEGGYGKVWLAEEVDSRASVALKVARAGDEQAQRFDYEIKLTRSLDHPHLLGANTVEKEGKTRYLVLPHAVGGSLKERLKEGRLQVEEAVKIAMDIAAALGYLHQWDIIHRDVHPGNVLFTKEGVVKLADLGVAQSKESGTSLYGATRNAHPGNPFYLPPEAFAREGQALLPLYPSADVYMLGAVLWEMLTGRLYYNTRGKPLQELCPDVPEWLEDLLSRMVAEQPNERPEDGLEVANLLQDGVKQELAKHEEAQRMVEEQVRQKAAQRAAEVTRLKAKVQATLGREDWRQAEQVVGELENLGMDGKRAAEEVRKNILQARKDAEVRTLRAAEQRAAEIARLQVEIQSTLGREDWSRAEQLVNELAGLGEDGKREAVKLREQVINTRKKAEARDREKEEKQRAAEIARLQREAEAALARKDWKDAKRLITQLKNLGSDGRAVANRLGGQLPLEVWKMRLFVAVCGLLPILGIYFFLVAPIIGVYYYRQGITHSEAGDYELAIADYTKAIELDIFSDDSDYYCRRGESYNNAAFYNDPIGDYELAIADYTKAIQGDPNNPEYYNVRGITYCNKGNYDQAIADYNKAIELDPDNPDYYYRRGQSYYSAAFYNDPIGDYKLAIADYTKAIELNPDNPDYYFERGKSYYCAAFYNDPIGDYELAIADYTKAIQLNPNKSDYYYVRGISYHNNGDYDLAIIDNTKAIQLDPDNGEYYYSRSLSYRQKGDTTQADADLAKATQLGYTK